VVPDHKDRYSPRVPVQSAAGRSFIEPGSPWRNPFVESFSSRVRDQVLSVEAFDSVLNAQTVITDWRTIYDHRRPHSSLGWRLPAAYVASLTTNKSEKLARLS
jgi:putative transposase